jgi:hypothetical protein
MMGRDSRRVIVGFLTLVLIAAPGFAGGPPPTAKTYLNVSGARQRGAVPG